MRGGVEKGDNPLSFPAARSNGERLLKVSTQAKSCPRSPDTLDAWLPSPLPFIWRFGAPRVDHVEDEADLLETDDRRAAFLLYRRVGSQD